MRDVVFSCFIVLDVGLGSWHIFQTIRRIWIL